MLDNIIREVGNRESTFFWLDLWLDGKPLKHSCSRLYKVAENKLVTVAYMYAFGWG